MTLFWLTNKHTCTPEETVCHCPVACCLTAQFALPNPTGTGKDGINHYCPYHTQEIRETGPPEMNSDWSAIQDRSHVCCFVEFYGRICFALATSSHWYCPDDSYVKTESPRNQAWVRHSMSGLWNHTSAWNMTFPVVGHFAVSIGDQSLSLEFWHVNNSGLCTVNLLSWWLLRHGTLILYLKITGKNILNHYWYVVLFKKTNLSLISVW